MSIRIIILCLGLALTNSADPATVTVGVRVEFVNFAQIVELSSGEIVHQTNSPFCDKDERGIICQ